MKKTLHILGMVGVCLAFIGFLVARPLIRPLLKHKRSEKKEDNR